MEQLSNPVDTSSKKVTVDLLGSEEESKWEAFVREHSDGHIYHTLTWKKVTSEGFGHESYFLRAIDKSNAILGILPLFLVKGIYGRRLVSVPMRDRGGILANNAQTASHLVSRAIELTRELKSRYLELRSLQEIDPLVVSQNNLHCERYWITTRIDLSPGVDSLWKALDKKSLRWAIKKAGKLGVQIEVSDGLEGIETFYEIFVRTRRSMGIPPFSKKLFISIWEHLIQKDKANLFLAWKDHVAINGMINLFSKDTFIPAYAAPQNEWRKHYPSEFVIWNTIEWAATNGFYYYDFGADSPNQKGLLWFKKKWGGVQHPMYNYYFLNDSDSPPNFDSTSKTYSVLRKVWSHLPISVCKHLGGWVTRQLS
jgi:FemAB-related protein (PEP-CTERM system-associated)